ncbi:MAG: MFS transporter, partial [Chloroflexi bacterium]|nr:MFS transporter [Chloroflexota bacterium]
PAESLRAGLRQQVSDLRKVLSNRGILLLMLATGVRGLGTRGLSIFLALYMSRTLGMSTARVGLYLGLLTFLSIAVGPLLGGLSDRVGRKKVLLVVLVWLTLFPLTFGYVGSGLALAIVLALYGAAGFAPQPIVQAAIVDLSGGLRAQASILGLLWSSNVLFSAMAPIIGGLIADSIGYRAVFLYAAGMSAVSVLCVAIAPFTSRESVRA